MTLFGNEVFADVIKVRWGHSGLGEAYIRSGKFGHRHVGRRPCEDRAEIRVMHLQSKDCQQPQEARTGKEGFFPKAFGGRMALLIS